MTIKQSKEKNTNRKENPYRVIPNLSLRGKDIMSRLRNGSLQINNQGQYSLDEEIDATRRMSKTDILEKAKQNRKNITDLENKLQSQSKKTKNG